MESHVADMVVTDLPTAGRRWPRARIINLVALAMLLGGYALAFAQLHGYEAGITRTSFTIQGAIPTPVLYLAPAVRRGDLIAIIVHGYSGSKDLMVGFGLELARMGVPSYLLDLPGHGESDVPLDAGNSAQEEAQFNTILTEVIRYASLASHPLDGGTVPQFMLIGHSLGTLAVGKYALSNPPDTIAATVLISPILQDMPTIDHPRNLLIIVGQNDIPALIPLAKRLFLASCGGGSLQQYLTHGHEAYFACENSGTQTQRELYLAPGANHITILTDAQVYQKVDEWARITDDIPLTTVQSNTRIAWLLVSALCAFLALFPLFSLATEMLPLRGTAISPGPMIETTAPPQGMAPTDARASTRAGEMGIILLLAGAGVAVTVLFLHGWSVVAAAQHMPGIRTPLAWLHMALADYVGSFSLVLALALLGFLRLTRGRVPQPDWRQARWQVVLGGIAFLALYLLLAPLVTFGWERLLLSWPRVWRFAVLLLANVPLFALIEGMATRRSAWEGVLLRLGTFLFICVGYAAAIGLDASLGFLALLIPIQGLLFVAFTVLAQWAARTGKATALASAIFMAASFAWVVAAVFPIVQ